MKKLGITVMVCGLAAVAVTVHSVFMERAVPTAGRGVSAGTVIVDAGHGGMDIGGASASGMLEKEVNLDVSKRLGKLLTLGGYDVIMTREDDGSPGGGERFIKKNDIVSRIKLAEDNPDALFVSIHMNIFTDSRYSGAQMFCDSSGGTRRLAERLQGLIKMHLQPENDRQVKTIPGTVYLFSHIKNPAILAECGFLSNPAEAERLADDGYRKRLAVLLFCGIDGGMRQGIGK